MNILARYFFIFLMFVIILTSHLAGVSMLLQVKPALLYIILFFFSLFFDSRGGYISIFFLGILEDSLSVQVLGITALQYLVFLIFVSSNSRALMQQRFNIVWAAFAGVYLLISIINQFLISFTAPYKFMINDSFWKSYILTVICYPLFHTILIKIVFRLFPGERNLV